MLSVDLALRRKLANKLKLNDEKTMFLLLGRPSKLEKVNLTTFYEGAEVE